ncbi:WbqC family protein [Kaistella sp. PBT33-4]|uniref:WbqC family protein n=1 Tax=Kaistella sp. PBT33-4 TaxID=3032000 RepID=UPI0023D8697C|nr:WbqC family protein [Kaistella sp. PBT33-4]MDF0718778.1 WbqC family protein [Kaistella sp. PBT33-4]
MTAAIMQPYFFPYIGYFQMINAVDVFVFYDDVNFIKKGWVNRNNFLLNGRGKLFTIPLKDASQNKMINEVKTILESPDVSKILETIKQNYKKAPFFQGVFPVIERVFRLQNSTIGDLAMVSIQVVNEYLGITTVLQRSSMEFADTKGLERAERLIAICKQVGAETYINAIGGQELYSKEYFASKGIDLKFIKSEPLDYKQFDHEFVPWLSIIDVMMFNSVEDIRKMLKYYTLS